MGRPSIFTSDMANAICCRLADGQSLRKICLDEDMPARSTVFEWLATNAEFADQYARARDAQADSLADEIIDIADELGDPQANRLRVDARKWYASKMAPKRYGEKIETTHTGPNGGPITVIHRTIIDPRDTDSAGIQAAISAVSV